LSLNLWLLPPPVSAHNQKRLKTFVALAKAVNPDFITLQEVWLKQYIGYLKRRLPEYHFIYSKPSFLNKSGLLTLSKYKPVSSNFKEYDVTKDYKFTEAVCRKGFQRIVFDIKGKKVVLLNTHLYAPYAKNRIYNLRKKDKEIRVSQFNVLKEATKNDRFAVVSGDLNLTSEELSSLNGGYFVLENNKHHTWKPYDYKSKLTNPSIRPLIRFAKFILFEPEKERKLDHLLVKSKNEDVNIISRVIKEPVVSDHLPILSSIVLL
jgi:exonuclease III